MFCPFFFQTNGHALWSLLEEDGVFCPEDLKLILGVTKFDSLFALANLDVQEGTSAIQNFMQTRLHELLPPSELEKYYGLFQYKPTAFELVPGHIQVLKALAETAKKKLISNKRKMSGEEIPAPAKKKVPSTSTSAVANASSPSATDLQRILEKSVNSYIKGNFKPDVLKEAKVVPSVTADGLGSFVAIAPCPFKNCEEKRKVTRNDLRWNTSNFYSHMWSHIRSRKSSGGEVKNPIAALFSKAGTSSSTSRAGSRRKGVHIISSDDSENEDNPPEVIDESSSSQSNKSVASPGEASTADEAF
ncbi:hypothetical protein ONE63_011604 [Megalurothrips usitatus]|uniref:Uncharacterized protein n=1 Tax=Megalurothrips usitatus TaxID=439358 RepID=A0AAV7X2U1_9NEOP|nr:hypothetical protein ONE63_011604 [Megalurothrips usitatus]